MSWRLTPSKSFSGTPPTGEWSESCNPTAGCRVNELVGRVNVSRATTYQRLARRQETGVIRRSTVEVDPKKLGLPIAAGCWSAWSSTPSGGLASGCGTYLA